jgi:hypothetical protein
MANVRTTAALFWTLIGGLLLPGLVLAAELQFVCIASNGALTVREDKCLSSEVKATLATLRQRGGKGATGQTGSAGIKNRQIQSFTDFQNPVLEGSLGLVFSFCNDGEAVLGGGCRCSGMGCSTGISSASPLPLDTESGERQGWRCALNSLTTLVSGNFSAHAVCADAN